MYFKNFTFKEIFTRCTKNEIVDALADKKVMSNILDLLHLLQQIRDNANCAVYINSAYRNHAHNERVGGVFSSQHLLGQAADIHILGNMRVLYRAINDFASQHPHEIGQVIMYLPKKCQGKCYGKDEISELAVFFHVALPNEKYKSFTPSIQLI